MLVVVLLSNGYAMQTCAAVAPCAAILKQPKTGAHHAGMHEGDADDSTRPGRRCMRRATTTLEARLCASPQRYRDTTCSRRSPACCARTQFTPLQQSRTLVAARARTSTHARPRGSCNAHTLAARHCSSSSSHACCCDQPRAAPLTPASQTRPRRTCGRTGRSGLAGPPAQSLARSACASG